MIATWINSCVCYRAKLQHAIRYITRLMTRILVGRRQHVYRSRFSWPHYVCMSMLMFCGDFIKLPFMLRLVLPEWIPAVNGRPLGMPESEKWMSEPIFRVAVGEEGTRNELNTPRRALSDASNGRSVLQAPKSYFGLVYHSVRPLRRLRPGIKSNAGPKTRGIVTFTVQYFINAIVCRYLFIRLSHSHIIKHKIFIVLLVDSVHLRPGEDELFALQIWKRLAGRGSCVFAVNFQQNERPIKYASSLFIFHNACRNPLMEQKRFAKRYDKRLFRRCFCCNSH